MSVRSVNQLLGRLSEMSMRVPVHMRLFMGRTVAGAAELLIGRYTLADVTTERRARPADCFCFFRGVSAGLAGKRVFGLTGRAVR